MKEICENKNQAPMVLTQEDINAIMVAFEPKFAKIDRRFLDMDQRFDRVEHRLTNVEHRLTNVEDRLTNVEQGLKNLTSEFHEFKHVCNKRFTAIELRLDSIEFAGRPH